MTFYKKILILLFFLLFMNFFTTRTVFADEPMIYSPSAILIDSNTGTVLYEKEANTLMYPASTTKVLTAIIAIESCSLDEKTVASEQAITSIKSGYTNAKIQVGEELTIEDLLYALMLKSANEAANVIAEYIGGTSENFANIMNAKAIELGCTSTHFVNANGIHDENHYTTASDLAKITRYCMQNKLFRHIASTEEYTLPATPQYPIGDRVLKNTNSLMNRESPYYYPYVIGGKTGFTTQAKNCMIAMSLKDGLELISIVFHAETTEDGRSARYLDTISLLEYGNNNFMQYAVSTEKTAQEKMSEMPISDSATIAESSDSIQNATPETSESTSIQFWPILVIVIILIVIRVVVAFLQHRIIVFRAGKIKKRARKFLNP